MKKGLVSKLGATALVLSLVTASLVGGTFAKYTKAVTSEATVTLAGFNLTATADLDFGTISPITATSAEKKLTINPDSDVKMEVEIAMTNFTDFPTWAHIEVSGGDITTPRMIDADNPVKFTVEPDVTTPVVYTFTCVTDGTTDVDLSNEVNGVAGKTLTTNLTITGTQVVAVP